MPNTAFACVPVKDRNPNTDVQAISEAFYLQLFSFSVQNYTNRYLLHLLSTWKNISPLDLCMARKGMRNILFLSTLFKKIAPYCTVPQFPYHASFPLPRASCHLSFFIYLLAANLSLLLKLECKLYEGKQYLSNYRVWK